MDVFEILQFFADRLPFLQTCIGQHDIGIGDRRFRSVRELGAGGYATVYLVRELPTPQRPSPGNQLFALKQIRAGSSEQLRLAEEEIGVMKKLSHPALVPLLASAIVPADQAARPGEQSYIANCLLPYYPDGSLVDVLAGRQPGRARLQAQAALSIFVQICRGVQSLHAQGYMHRDIKAQNVMLEAVSRSPSAAASPHSCDAGSADGERSALTGAEADASIVSYRAVLIDFGSATRSRWQVSSRAEALELQEEMQMCTTPSCRAPELFDIPSNCTIDERVDVWALGCLLYHSMCGIGPFDRVVAHSGGSLALSILNGTVIWDTAEKASYPLAMIELVEWCLTVDAVRRPTVAQVLERAEPLLASLPPDDDTVSAMA